ncbi:MAG: fibronectin type III domain-containing protein [Oscillospiraceae bacterium]|nr:fibronectin type III domain-containing protein [Oscillospiraceae bacterium]
MTVSIHSTTYTATDLTNGTEYGFKVKAYVDGKWSAASVIAWATPEA